MHRRDALAALAGTGTLATLSGSFVGSAAARATSRASGRTVAQDASFGPLDRLELDGVRDLATNDDGSVAYVAIDDGVATVDCSDPQDLSILDERGDFFADHAEGPLDLVWDVWPDGDRLVAVGPANGSGGPVYGLALLDVSDPSSLEVVDEYETPFPIHNSFFEDDVVFLTANGEPENPVVLLDADGDDLEEVGRWSVFAHEDGWAEFPNWLYQIHDVYAQDGVAYLAYWEAGTYVLDVSDPAAPQYLGHTSDYEPADFAGMDDSQLVVAVNTPPGNHHYVQVDETGDLLVVGSEAWEVQADGEIVGGPGPVDLYDASDPADIEHYARIDAPAADGNTRDDPFTTAHNLDIVDGRLYTSWYHGGVRVHDVTDPSDPEEVAAWSDDEEAAFWTARSAVPGDFFVASSADEVTGLNPDIQGAVYAFPDGPDERVDVSDDSDDGTSTDARDGTDPDADGTTDSTTDGDDGTSTDDGDDDDSVPGFGALAAVGGLTAAGYGLLRRRDESDPGEAS